MVKYILFVFLSIILSLSFFIIGHDPDLNEKYERTWTTAICEGNQCRDFEIRCLGSEVLDMRPISGLVIFSDTWEDKMENNVLC